MNVEVLQKIFCTFILGHKLRVLPYHNNKIGSRFKICRRVVFKYKCNGKYN